MLLGLNAAPTPAAIWGTCHHTSTSVPSCWHRNTPEIHREAWRSGEKSLLSHSLSWGSLEYLKHVQVHARVRDNAFAVRLPTLVAGKSKISWKTEEI